MPELLPTPPALPQSSPRRTEAAARPFSLPATWPRQSSLPHRIPLRRPSPHRCLTGGSGGRPPDLVATSPRTRFLPRRCELTSDGGAFQRNTECSWPGPALPACHLAGRWVAAAARTRAEQGRPAAASTTRLALARDAPRRRRGLPSGGGTACPVAY